MRKLLSTLLVAVLAAFSFAAPAAAMIYGADRVKTTSGYVFERDVATLFNAIYSVTTTATPASGTCGVQFVFKDARGNAIAAPQSLPCFLSNSGGTSHETAITSFAVLTNGALTQLVAGKVALATTSAAGLLGVTLTGNAATYYLTFVLPNGKHLTSSALTIN